MIIIFVLGYAAIALEHPIKVDKAASALIIGGLGWALFAFSGVDHHTLTHEIQHHIVDIAEILFFTATSTISGIRAVKYAPTRCNTVGR